MTDYFSDIRAARNGLEAALAVSDCEAARAGWRVLHHALVRHNAGAVRDAARLLDEVITCSADEQLIQAKQRYDDAFAGRSSAWSRH